VIVIAVSGFRLRNPNLLRRSTVTASLAHRVAGRLRHHGLRHYLEACAIAHNWARQLLEVRHDLRLIPSGYVKPFVRRGAKNDATDTAAICEAVTRPSMRFAPIKSKEDQAFPMLHRARGLLVRQRTMAACAFQANLAEHGVVVAQGRHRVDALVAKLDEIRENLPEDVCFALDTFMGQMEALNRHIERIDARPGRIHQTNSICRVLATIPGIGPIAATAFAVTIPDPSVFRSPHRISLFAGNLAYSGPILAISALIMLFFQWFVR
ncbi:IS110 family transposase, partial [Defluviimonas sp. WL0075]